MSCCSHLCPFKIEYQVNCFISETVTAVCRSQGRPPGPEMEYCTDRESYSLAAGLALGMVCLGVSVFPKHFLNIFLFLECSATTETKKSLNDPFAPNKINAKYHYCLRSCSVCTYQCVSLKSQSQICCNFKRIARQWIKTKCSSFRKLQ